MKFVLAIVLVFTVNLFAFSQNPAPEETGPRESLSLPERMTELDSLNSDPAVQTEMNQLAYGLLSSLGLAPDQILYQPLPDFSLTDLQGNTLTNEQLFGQVTFLLIWDVDYQPSANTIRQLNELNEAYRYQDVRFLAITAAPAKKLEKALKNTTLPFHHLPDAFQLIADLGFVPQSILVDRNGIIRYTTANAFKLLQPETTDLRILREVLDELLME